MASPATLMASSLAENFRDEEDKIRAQKLFELNTYRKSVNTEEYRRIAEMIASFTLAGKGQSESQRDLEMASLRLAGLANGGVTLLSDEQQKEVLSTLLPRAMGEGPDSSFYSEHLSQLLLRYVNPDDSAPVLSKEVKAHLDQYLNAERVSWLLSRVESGAIASPFDEFEGGDEAKPLDSIREKYSLPKEAPVQDSPAVNGNNPDAVAKLSSDAIDESKASATLEERVNREAAKHKVNMDLQVDALNRMNALFNKQENVSWAEKSVWDKVSKKVGQKVDRVFLRDPIQYPKESLFSKTLVDMDPETMLTRRELLRFNTIGSFKATFPSSKVSDDVYAYAALSAMSKGIKYPLIKSTFTDPNESYQFVMNMTKSLVEAGYDVNDIRVSPHLRKIFESRIKPHYAQENALEEAPEALVNDPTVSPDKIGPGGDGPVEPPNDEQPRFEQDAVNKLESLKEMIKSVNEHPLKISRGMNGDENQNSFSDLTNEDIGKIVELAPLLSLPDEGWQDLVEGSGLAPEARRQVEKTVDYMERLVESTVPDEQGRTKMDPARNTKQLERLNVVAPFMKEAMPEAYKTLTETMPLLGRPPADESGFLIPEELWRRKPTVSNSNDEYTKAMSQQALHDWEKEVEGLREAHNNDVKQDELKQNNVTVQGEDADAPLPPENESELPPSPSAEEGPPAYFNEVPLPESELHPIADDDEKNLPVEPDVGQERPQVDESKPVEQQVNVKEEVASEPAEPASPYAEEWVARVGTTDDVTELSADDIKAIVELDESKVAFFNSTPPNKDEMGGAEFSTLRRQIQAVRDAINPFQDDPSHTQVAIMKKLPESYLKDIMPSSAIDIMNGKEGDTPANPGEADLKQSHEGNDVAPELDNGIEKESVDPMDLTDSMEPQEELVEPDITPEQPKAPTAEVNTQAESPDLQPSIDEPGAQENAPPDEEPVHGDDSMAFTQDISTQEELTNWMPPEPPPFETPPLPSEEEMGPENSEDYTPIRRGR